MTDPLLVAARRAVTESFDGCDAQWTGSLVRRSIGVRPERTPIRLPYSSPTQ